MKILWASNAPYGPTGYSNQTALMLPRLREAGHQVAVGANWGLQGDMLDWDGFTVYPAGQKYSNDVMPAHAKHWFAGDEGWLIWLYDAWALKSPAYTEMNVAVWTPVDHHPVPPLVVQHFKDHGSVPIAMSKWGRDQLAKAGLDPLYAPHGVDTNVFRPYDKREAKIEVGLDPDKFTVGIVANNSGTAPSRKAYPEMFAAFSLFHQENPDTHLYVHAEMTGEMADGIDLEYLGAARGIPETAMTFADQYALRLGLPAEKMARLYSAFDLLLFTSMGEGFGIPVLEAQACGTPVMVHDFSAQSELVAHEAGFLVPVGQPWWDEAQKSDFHMPSIGDIVPRLQYAYDSRDKLAHLSAPCRDFALTYDADRVFEKYWVPVLDELEQRLPSVEPLAATPV